MKSSRRSFLEAGLALPAILNAVPTLAETAQAKIVVTKDSSFDPWVEIHRENESLHRGYCLTADEMAGNG